MTPLAKPLNPAQLIAGLRARRGGRADFSDRGRQHVHPAARCGVMECLLAAGVWIGNVASEPGRGHVIADNTCACRRHYHYSDHRRYGIGGGQETKSPSQRPAGSGRCSTQRRALQPIQSRAHRRRQSRLQSKPHDLEVRSGLSMPKPIECSPVARAASRPPCAHGVKRVAFSSARSSPASTCGLTTLIGRPAAKARIWSKMSLNCVSYSSRVT
jgi:hypothetical protein